MGADWSRLKVAVRTVGGATAGAALFAALLGLGAVPATAAPTSSSNGTSNGAATSHRTDDGKASGTPSTITPGATSGGRVTFGIEPASATGPDGRPNFSFGVTPGGVLDDYAAVVNYSSQPLSLQVYATDAIETSTGGFGLLTAATKPTGVGTWISIPSGDATVDVPPEASGSPGHVVIPLSLHVPADASPGDHVGGIVASLQTVGTNSSGQSVVLDQRIGSRVFVTVAGPAKPGLAVEDVGASYEGTINPFGKGKVDVSYVVRNTGNEDLEVTQSVAVSQLFVSDGHAKVRSIPLLLPGASVTEHAVVTGLWPQFLLQATVTAVGHPPAGSGAKTVTATGSATVWAIPWPLIALVVLVLLLAYAIRRLRRRARARSSATPPSEDRVEVGV